MEMGNLYPAEETAAVELHFGERVEITGGGKTRLGCRACNEEKMFSTYQQTLAMHLPLIHCILFVHTITESWKLEKSFKFKSKLVIRNI